MAWCHDSLFYLLELLFSNGGKKVLFVFLIALEVGESGKEEKIKGEKEKVKSIWLMKQKRVNNRYKMYW